MINGGNATIYVADLDRAVTFYTATLGLQLVYRAGNHWASIRAGDFDIGLHPAGPQTPASGTAGAVCVGLSVDEPIERVVAVLRARGVAFHGPVTDDGPVKLAFFADPDGNPLYLADGNGAASNDDGRPEAASTGPHDR